ncbi:helix-turn-helix domain-containing protein [Thalassovita sp.]|uniref:winged helix-turn-helix transcriptional regulator n=1 Tax=Thalassovita sp. TaxID=1979401 RepID=UPI0029DE5B43|nr:helix-turn-helix domain-containing protein [Thalassovita sp.]
MGGRHTQTCAVAGFLNVFGDAWTLLIVREALYGATRFTQIQRNTGIARNLLSERLAMLVREGILEKVEVGTSGIRHAYHLTDKGRSLEPLLISLVLWANAHIYGPGKEPTLVLEKDTGQIVHDLAPITQNGDRVNWQALTIEAGPTASDAARRRLQARDKAMDRV